MSETKKPGNQSEQEKNQGLTEAERKRLVRFEALSALMAEKGYRRVDLTIGMGKATVFSVVLLIPLLIIGFGLFMLLNRGEMHSFEPMHFLVFLAVFLVLTAVHELIHGVSWAIFSAHHWKDIDFGIMRKSLTPYCTCCVPLTKGQYIFGAMMPLLILGIIPMIAGIVSGSMLVLLLGILMADGAAGDIMIVWNFLRYKSQAKDIVYMDHPTQAGSVVFEK